MKKNFIILLFNIILFCSCNKSDSPTVSGPTGKPDQPVLVSPANNSTAVTRPATFKWNASSGASSYTLQVSAFSDLSLINYNQTGITGTSQVVDVLSHDIKYYWRVKAENSYGSSAWSDVWNLTIESFVCGKDSLLYYGAIYHTVQIGGQCWLKENLNIGTRINGTVLATNNQVIEKYCYNDQEAYCTLYGGLYYWNEAMQYSSIEGSRGICPYGWHIPTLSQMQSLGVSVNGVSNALKEKGEGTGAGAGTNISGFSALLGGYLGNAYFEIGNAADFWTSSVDVWQPQKMQLAGNSPVITYTATPPVYGYSIRCIKD
jgi:uncharacterized protein (TIGR02145 family)